MRLSGYVFLLFLYSSSTGAKSLKPSYQVCFSALEKRIQTYCNCSIEENKYLILTGTSGLKARVEINTTPNGLPDVAWVLNQVNRSGHPGKMKSYVESSLQDTKVWVIEESIRKWDLENTKDGLSMGVPQKVKRQYRFQVSKGECRFQDLEVGLEIKSEKSVKTLNGPKCEEIESTRYRSTASAEKPGYHQYKAECQSIKDLQQL